MRRCQPGAAAVLQGAQQQGVAGNGSEGGAAAIPGELQDCVAVLDHDAALTGERF